MHHGLGARRRSVSSEPAAASTAAPVVITPSGRMLSEPAIPTKGAASAPRPKRAVPRIEPAVPAICGYSDSASVVPAGDENCAPEASRNSEAITTASGIGTSPVRSRPRHPAPVSPIPRNSAPCTFHRSAVRPPSHPKSTPPAEFSANAAAYHCGDRP